MAKDDAQLSLKAMNTVRLAAAILGIGTLAAFHTSAQNAPYLYRMTFRGMVYQTNTINQVVAKPITEKDLLLAAAQAGGTSDISTMALVYHIQGSGLGDNIEIYDVNTRQQLAVLFGLYFGNDASLYRFGLTNSVNTEMRRIDYFYGFVNSIYSYPNQGGHSMGSSFTTKRFLGDARGNVHTTIDGVAQWVVSAFQGAGQRLITGTFTTTKPF